MVSEYLGYTLNVSGGFVVFVQPVIFPELRERAMELCRDIAHKGEVWSVSASDREQALNQLVAMGYVTQKVVDFTNEQRKDWALGFTPNKESGLIDPCCTFTVSHSGF